MQIEIDFYISNMSKLTIRVIRYKRTNGRTNPNFRKALNLKKPRKWEEEKQEKRIRKGEDYQKVSKNEKQKININY